jgi:hypothetical protein
LTKHIHHIEQNIPNQLGAQEQSEDEAMTNEEFQAGLNLSRDIDVMIEGNIPQIQPNDLHVLTSRDGNLHVVLCCK